MDMLKERLVGLTIKALSRVINTRDRVRSTINNDVVKGYLKGVTKALENVVEKNWTKFSEITSRLHGTKIEDKALRPLRSFKKKQVKTTRKTNASRKSSIKPAKEIVSKNASVILKKIHDSPYRLVKKDETIDGKKSLAYVVWALGQAKEASINEGLSIHDISAVLYQACNLQLYPINISLVVHKNPNFVQAQGLNGGKKTYILTEDGVSKFNHLFKR